MKGKPKYYHKTIGGYAANLEGLDDIDKHKKWVASKYQNYNIKFRIF